MGYIDVREAVGRAIEDTYRAIGQADAEARAKAALRPAFNRRPIAPMWKSGIVA